MTESIEVYFKNENDAESAQAELRTLKVNHMYVEEMPEDTDITMFVPFYPTSVDGRATGSTGGPVTPIIPEIEDNDSGPNYPSYLLYVDVETDDYEEVLSILKDHHCYMREDE